jgi:peroxiredoxin Q/BCP
VIIGISTDKLEDQTKFTKRDKLNFPLFADPDKKIARTYGVLSPRGFAARTTFVIDKKGVIRKIYKVTNAGDHPEEVLAWVKKNLAKDS